MQSLVLIVCSMLPCDSYYAGKLVENDTSRFVEEDGGEVNCEIDVHSVDDDAIFLDLIQRSVSGGRLSDPFIQSGNWFIAFTCDESHSFDALPSDAPFQISNMKLFGGAIVGTRVRLSHSSRKNVPENEYADWQACFCRVDEERKRILCMSNKVPVGRFPIKSRFTVANNVRAKYLKDIPKHPVDIKLTRSDRNEESLDWIVCNISRSYATIVDPFLWDLYELKLPVSIRIMPRNVEFIKKDGFFKSRQRGYRLMMVPPRAIIGVDLRRVVKQKFRSEAFVAEVSGDFYRPLALYDPSYAPFTPLPTIRFTLEAQRNP